MGLKKDIEIMPFGEAALLVNFVQEIDEAVNSGVIQLAEKIKKEKLKGVLYVQPAYCSLTVGFNPERLNFEFLKTIISKLFRGVEKSGHLENAEKTKWDLPVCYEAECAPDMPELESLLKL